ncbi:MAG TPA: ubiquinol-cytochrome c reductase iron-sulfur subunit [Vicinamibacterales bacterium]|nr:ubiquinol-cytochrome c reductase iron-sulfur subunit [Vicinamibacterales bacterium]
MSTDREQITIPPDFKPPEAQPAWRQDFPIDWPQDHYVERRDFMKFLVLISGAMTLGQFWIATRNWFRRRHGAAEIRRIASIDDIAVGSTIVFQYPGEHDPCVLVRLDESAFVAYSQQCTHLSCAVIPRPERGDIHCPCHNGIFDLRTGRPMAGPPPRPLPRITLSFKGRDVYAMGVEEGPA